MFLKKHGKCKLVKAFYIRYSWKIPMYWMYKSLMEGIGINKARLYEHNPEVWFVGEVICCEIRGSIL